MDEISDELRSYIINEFNREKPGFDEFIKGYVFKRRYLQLPFFIDGCVDFVVYDSEQKTWSINFPVGSGEPIQITGQHAAYFDEKDVKWVTMELG